MNEHALPLLGLAYQHELLQELPQGHVQGILLKVEILEVFFRYDATEIVAMETKEID